MKWPVQAISANDNQWLGTKSWQPGDYALLTHVLYVAVWHTPYGTTQNKALNCRDPINPEVETGRKITFITIWKLSWLNTVSDRAIWAGGGGTSYCFPVLSFSSATCIGYSPVTFSVDDSHTSVLLQCTGQSLIMTTPITAMW